MPKKGFLPPLSKYEINEEGGIHLKTKITIVTGEEYELEGIYFEDFAKSLHNQIGVYVSKLIKINEKTLINSNQIVKIEHVQS